MLDIFWVQRKPSRVRSVCVYIHVCASVNIFLSTKQTRTDTVVVGREALLQGPKSRLLSDTWKRIVWGDTCWHSERVHCKKAPRWRVGGWGNPEERLCHVAHSLRYYGDRINFLGVFGQSFWLRVLPGGARITQPRWTITKGILGGGRTYGVSFWPFPNSSRWLWLISSIFLTRTSCCKITHANGY